MQNEKVQDLMNQLEQGVAGIYTSEQWKQVLQMQASFHSYSFNNMLLIWLQMPTATRVAGFHTWKQLGRYVKKGEKGLQIFAPLIKKFETEKENETGEMEKITNRKLYGFRIVTVFDISQTEGKPLPNPVVLYEQGDDEEAEKLLKALSEVITIPVSYASKTEDPILEGGALGYYTPSRHDIVLRDDLSTYRTLTTLVHEYVHSLLHHKNSNRKEKTRGQREAEAEGTAYVVCTYFGLDTSAFSFGYVAQWAHDDKGIELIQEIGNTIQTTARDIIQDIEGKLNKAEQIPQGA